MSFSSLAQLAEQSKQLTKHMGGLDLPQLARGIDQIESQSRKLASKASKPTDPTDSRAHFLLATSGIDTKSTHNALNTINLRSTYEPFQPIHDTDTKAFLRHQHEQIIVSTIDESRRETVVDFDSNFETSLNYDWERTKKRIFEELGHSQGQSAGSNKSLRQSESGFRGQASLGLSQSSGFAPGLGQSPTTLEVDFSKLKPYYKVVHDLCEARLQSAAFPLARSFTEASREAHKSQPNPKIQETWELLVSVLGEPDVRNGLFQNKTLKERVYATPYLMSPYNSPTAASLRERLLKGSKTYLEKQYMKHIEAAISENPTEAALGGVPSLINTIRAFVQLKYGRYGSSSQPRLEFLNNQAVWAQIYYLFRSGHGKEALELATEIRGSLAPADQPFVDYLNSYLTSEDRALSPSMQERLLSDFNQRIRYSSDTVDPYKLTLYKIIGRCELKKRTTPVIGALEDFMWLQLALVRETKSDTMLQDKYDIEDFQKLVLKYGPTYFNPNNNNPLQYFQVLVHSQQFERAIFYLWTSRAFNLETVHMAIALTYYGLLRIPAEHRASDPNPFSVTEDAQGHQLACYNFTQLIHYQARIIAEQYPTEALRYLYQICLNTDLSPRTSGEQSALCHSYIQELVLQAKDYSSLLGSRSQGIKTPGAIEKYLPLIKVENSQQFVRKLTIEAAKTKSMEGRVEDAIQLYNIAEAYNQVVELMNRQLAEVVSNPGVQSNGGDSGVNIAAIRRQTSEYKNDPKVNQQILPRNLETCEILLRLVEFTDLYSRGKYEAAVNMIEDLDLIPFDADTATIAKKADQFQGLDECVARNFPDVLLKTMESLYRMYEALKTSPYDEAGRRDHINMLKRRARALMMFAGSIKFRMPADIYAKLNHLDVKIWA
ncbi:hypothetical protein BGZ99_001813 [Dissophora globulifera]|uniref:Nuclear pore protein n=1 Tax=Dissophora globulifera TaxID=979702 RepID=A0A9P6UXN3_9FUNG|nr:hypothetical protein BGZ99_001813 [Dissophora globulifera]